jgi:hypothetical protein
MTSPMTRAAFLTWFHPDLLDDRLLHGCALWQVITALGLPPDATSPPSSWPLSEVLWLGLSLAVGSARADQPRPAVFRLGSRSLQAQLFCLLDPEPAGGDATAPDPLDPEQWRFWLVPFHQLHPDRQSIGVAALLRAHGEGLRSGSLLPAVHALVEP